MEKEIIVNDQKYSFHYRDDSKFWYLGYEEVDIFKLGSKTNLTINKENVDWEEVYGFLQFITKDVNANKQKYELANSKLKVFFKEMYLKINPHLDYEQIYFTLCNIDYLGFVLQNENLVYQYTLNFNVGSIADNDFFSYDSWNVSFLNDEFKEVSKS